jgi:hypothetical protein
MSRQPPRPVACRAALLAAAVALLPATAGAQYLDDWHPYQTFWAVGWEAAVPMGSFRDSFVSAPSYTGGQFEFRIGVLGPLSVGAAASWNWFEQSYSNVTLQQPDYTFTGAVYRRLSTTSARLTVHYYLTQKTIQPYVGAGVGAVWTDTKVQAVDRRQQTYGVALGVDPEVGVLFNVVRSFSFYLLARYQFTLATFGEVTNAQWVAAQTGVAYYF